MARDIALITKVNNVITWSVGNVDANARLNLQISPTYQVVSIYNVSFII